jgi:hypothetical protein
MIRPHVRPLIRAFSDSALPAHDLLDDAISLLGVEPLHYWDFTTNRALFSGVDVGALASTPGWSFTRATVGTAETVAGEIVQFASSQLRRTDRGVLIEGARTNLFLNSATGATQGVVVTAVAHTLSFRGTGTITLFGASTAGPLVGTGVNDRVTLTFTPSAATLTLTVSGSCTNVQLEVGAFASSWIPTAGASVTRDADVLTVSSPGIAFPTSMWAEAVRAVDTAGIELSLRADNGGATELITLSVSNTTDLAQATMTAGGVSQANPQVAGATSVGVTYKVAGAYETNRVQACRSGILATVDTVATVPSAPTVLRFGSNSSGAGQPFGYIRRAAVFNSALSDAQLQTITS